MQDFLQGDWIPKIPLDQWVDRFVDWAQGNLQDAFDVVRDVLRFLVRLLEAVMIAPPELVMVAILAAIAYFLSGWRVALFSVFGFFLLISLGLWNSTMLTLALIIASTIIALAIGIPLGILAAKSRPFEAAIRPILDVMQTMPAFVYLVPMIVFLGLGEVPALVATVVFAMPPAVRLTMLGIQQVPKDTVEAGQAFGATPMQTLRKVELPQALTTIMAGVNQVIMLSLSMVVIASLVGAGGLGEEVVLGLTQLDVGRAFVGGVGIVIIAIYLDRVTRSLSRAPQHGGVKRGLGLGKGGGMSKILPGRKKPNVDPDTAGTTGAGTEDTAEDAEGAEAGDRSR